MSLWWRDERQRHLHSQTKRRERQRKQKKRPGSDSGRRPGGGEAAKEDAIHDAFGMPQNRLRRPEEGGGGGGKEATYLSTSPRSSISPWRSSGPRGRLGLRETRVRAGRGSRQLGRRFLTAFSTD